MDNSPTSQVLAPKDLPGMNEFLLVFHFERPAAIPENPVALLRGLLGRALAHRFHPALPPAAPEEAIPVDSPYWALFKPRSGGRDEGRPPYLLECAWGAGHAVSLHVRLRTFGGSAAHARIYAEALETYPRLALGEFGERISCLLEWMRLPAPVWPVWPGEEAAPRPLALEFTSPAQLSVKLDPPLTKTSLDALLFDPVPGHAAVAGRPADPLPLLVQAAALSAARALEGFGARLPGPGGPALSRCLRDAAHDRTRFFRAALRRHENPADRAARRQPAEGVMGHLEMLADPLLAWHLECGALLGVGGRISHGCGRIALHPLH